jgi:serine/threonine protein kinase
VFDAAPGCEDIVSAHIEVLRDQKLGAGAAKDVYAATWKGVTDVAYAELRNFDQKQSSSIVNEMKALARLRHPSIVSVLGVCTFNRKLALVLERCDCSLAQRLTTAPPLSFAERLTILRELLEAVAFLHGSGVVHRDITPNNILLSKGHVKLADFGLVTVRGSAASPATGLLSGGHAAPSPIASPNLQTFTLSESSVLKS